MSAFDPLQTFIAVRRSLLVDERLVLVTQDGLGRMAIVRRTDGLFCLYEHWFWSVEAKKIMRVQPVVDRRWTDDNIDPNCLYDDLTSPLPGLFASVDEAERARSRENFADAVVHQRS